MTRADRLPWIVFTLIAFFYVVGFIGHAWPPLRPWMLGATPWFLVSAGLVIFWGAGLAADPKSLLFWLIPVFAVTFGLEVLGVASGLVFGPYHYSTVLGTLLWGVPPVIGWNWVLVVLGAYTATQHLLPRVRPWLRIVAVGVLCVLFDLLLEPVAIALGYWVWEGGSVPFQNYLAWGLIAMGMAWWAERFPGLATHPTLGWYALLQAFFFLALGVAGIRA